MENFFAWISVVILMELRCHRSTLGGETLENSWWHLWKSTLVESFPTHFNPTLIAITFRCSFFGALGSFSISRVLYFLNSKLYLIYFFFPFFFFFSFCLRYNMTTWFIQVKKFITIIGKTLSYLLQIKFQMDQSSNFF